MIVKVKEPQANERAMLKPGQVLFTYLHLAPDPAQTKDLVESGAVCIAYETVTSPLGGLPLLAPMSEVAGRLSVQAGAHCLEKVQGGNGTLLGGVPGVDPAKVVIIGGGVVGTHAAHIAMGMGAYIVWEARNLGMPKWKLMRMAGNVAFDSAVGAVPFVGDVFDFMFRSNTRNLRIVKKHLDKHHPGSRVIEQ